jgi:hypothetical protein
MLYRTNRLPQNSSTLDANGAELVQRSTQYKVAAAREISLFVRANGEIRMRVEQLHYLGFGAILALVVWACTRAISSAPIRIHLRTAFLALGFGFIVVPGHGELIVAPILASLTPPFRPQLLVLGGIFFLFWWAATLAIIKLIGRAARATTR